MKVKIIDAHGPQYEFNRCEYIWRQFLIELNWNNRAVNPLDCINQSFWPQVFELLKEAKYIDQTQEFYLHESDKYNDYLGKGGKGYFKGLND